MKHRTAFVTAASVVLVVLAGTTAAAANLGVLAADPTVASTAGIEQVPAVEGTQLQPLAEQPELLAYEIPEVGVIVVERAGNSLSVYQAQTPGWQGDATDSGPHLAVSFTDGTRRIEFTAAVTNDGVTAGFTEPSSGRGL
jgi:hypothetical protein